MGGRPLGSVIELNERRTVPRLGSMIEPNSGKTGAARTPAVRATRPWNHPGPRMIRTLTTMLETTDTTAPETATHGAALTFETIGAGPGPLRIRPDDVTLLRVVAGTVRLTTGAVERLLEPGDEAIVLAARPHRLAGVGGPARVVSGVRPTVP
jgi:hypothetical protein